MLALYGFTACVLQVYFRGVSADEMLSRLKRAIETVFCKGKVAHAHFVWCPKALHMVE
jgi:hypothetical protein